MMLSWLLIKLESCTVIFAGAAEASECASSMVHIYHRVAGSFQDNLKCSGYHNFHLHVRPPKINLNKLWSWFQQEAEPASLVDRNWTKNQAGKRARTCSSMQLNYLKILTTKEDWGCDLCWVLQELDFLCSIAAAVECSRLHTVFAVYEEAGTNGCWRDSCSATPKPEYCGAAARTTTSTGAVGGIHSDWQYWPTQTPYFVLVKLSWGQYYSEFSITKVLPTYNWITKSISLKWPVHNILDDIQPLHCVKFNLGL